MLGERLPLNRYILAGIALVLNVLISIYIATRDGLEKVQIIIQIVLVWLVPFFAAIGTWLFYRSQDRPSDRRKLEGNSHDSVRASDS